MYSSTTLKSYRRPPLPLPKSPVRLAPRTTLHPSDSLGLQTPPGSLTKSRKPILSPEKYHAMSCEFRALSKMVCEEFGKADSKDDLTIGNSSCGVLFKRGRNYNEYSARRNERLKRKKGVMVDEGNNNNKPKQSRVLGVTVESGKKSTTSRKLGSIRKSVSAAYSAEVSETPRYMLRSMTKENKKPPLAAAPLAAKFDRSVMASERKIGARRVGRV